MFQICKDKNNIKVERGSVRRLLSSLNEPMIAVSNHPAQQVRAYIGSIKTGESLFQVYISLFLSKEGVSVLYENFDKQMSASACSDAEEEAMVFCEQMGFMVGDLGFTELEVGEQERLLLSVPLFFKPEESQKKVEEPVVKSETDKVIVQEAPHPEEPVQHVEDKAIEVVEAQAAKAEPVIKIYNESPLISKGETKIEEDRPVPLVDVKKEAPEPPAVTKGFLSKFRMRASAEKGKKS